MAVEATTGNPVETESNPVLFPEVAILKPCTALYCGRGHEWAPSVAAVKCGYGTPNGWNGCGAPMLAIKQQNCPVCNEPAVRLHLRIDYTNPAPFPTPLCVPGSASAAETIKVDIPLRGHERVEQNPAPPVAVPTLERITKRNGETTSPTGTGGEGSDAASGERGL